MNCPLEILAGRGYSGQGSQMPFGVDALCLGCGSKQASDVGEAFVFGFFREGAVLLVGLALSSK
jgi:hypothetical protein